eukprot:XP_017949532.1 PREDICTED: uncharacterized protein htr3c [Xenopus tropicalis]
MQNTKTRPRRAAGPFFFLAFCLLSHGEIALYLYLKTGHLIKGEINCTGSQTDFLDSFRQVFLRKAFRPVRDLNHPTVVNISITVYAILGVNEKDQLLTSFLWLTMVWFNEFAEWEPALCGGVQNISVPAEEMWIPDIFVLQFVDEDKSPHLPYLLVDHNGRVRFLKPLRVVSSCNLSIFRFPFDIQNCTLTFGSFLDSVVQHIKLGLLLPMDNIERLSRDALTSQGEWELVKTESFFADEMVDLVTFNIIVKRRPILYVVNLLIPSAFLMLIDVLSFNLPPHTVDRASFKMTLLLGYTVFLLILNDLLPATSSGTPLIGIYFSLCLAMLVIGLLETVFVMNILHRGSSQCPAVPIWARTLVLQYLARLVCYKKLDQFEPESLNNSFISETAKHGKNINTQISQVEPTQGGLQTQLFLRNISNDLHSMRCLMEGYFEQQEMAEEWLLKFGSAELRCTEPASGPSYESLREVFDKKSLRPTLNYSRPTSVNISFTIYAVLGVNEKSQILTTFLWLRMFWYNEFLTWMPAHCGSVEKISLPVEDIWTPDIVVYEFIDEDKSQRTPFVYVNHTGRIRYDRMLRVVSSCNLGIFNFPFDVQNCSLTFGSYMHTGRDIRLGLALPVNQILKNSLQYLETSGEWELVNIEGSPDILKFGIDEWDIITFWVVIRRRPLLYVVNLLVPSAFLMLIDILSFFLPPHSTDRASFKMTLLLGYTVFLLIMNDLLPSTANGTPLIGIYFSVCLALLVLSLLETVIITHVMHRGAMQSIIMPAWVRSLVLGFIAQLICYRKKAVNADITLSPTNIISSCENATRPPASSSDHGGIQGNAGLFFFAPSEQKGSLPNVPELLPSDALYPGPEMQLALIIQNLRRVREMLESKHHLRAQEEEWMLVAYVLDSLLYRLYLIFIASYAIIIISVWCVWYNI